MWISTTMMMMLGFSRLALPEKYLIHHHPSARSGYWRLFQSENVVDLVRIRSQRAKQQGPAGAG
jgi:hypothetical protein